MYCLRDKLDKGFSTWLYKPLPGQLRQDLSQQLSLDNVQRAPMKVDLRLLIPVSNFLYQFP